MTLVASRELRNHTRQLLDRVDAGEAITIAVDGRAVAQLVPLEGRRRWLGRDEFVTTFGAAQADPELADELRELLPDTTDDDLDS